MERQAEEAEAERLRQIKAEQKRIREEAEARRKEEHKERQRLSVLAEEKRMAFEESMKETKKLLQ